MKTCPICHNDFLADGPARIYCSRACYYQSRLGTKKPTLYRRTIKTCPACSTEFESGGRAKHAKGAIFCSRECSRLGRFRSGAKALIMSDVEAAYLAGVIDGEGTIMLYRHGEAAALRLTVANTDERLLDWCKRTTGVGATIWNVRTNKRHSRAGTWEANADAAESTIRQILPYLVIKRAQADLALEFRDRIRIPAYKVDKTWQQEYRLRMKAMNARGPSPEAAAT